MTEHDALKMLGLSGVHPPSYIITSAKIFQGGSALGAVFQTFKGTYFVTYNEGGASTSYHSKDYPTDYLQTLQDAGKFATLQDDVTNIRMDRVFWTREFLQDGEDIETAITDATNKG